MILKTGYWSQVFKSRFLLSSLVKMDLRNKYRKSFLGLFWAFLYPFTLTLMMSVILSRVFKKSLEEYTCYVYIGFVVWDLVVQSATQGANSFLASEPYIKMQKKPLFVYVLRTCLVCTAQFLIGFTGVLIWVVTVGHKSPNINWLFLFPSILILMMWSVGIATIMAYITTFIRDIGQITLLLFQLIWYVSPIFIDKSAFLNGGLLQKFNEANPVNHLLELFRAPLINRGLPTLSNFLISIFAGLLFVSAALTFQKILERKVIFYL